MGNLPKSIIKKYGISKKAWSVYRGTKTRKKTGGTMARRKKGRYRRKMGMGKSGNLIQFDAMAYGAVRQFASNLIAPLTSKIPIVGNLSDEVGMGIINYFVAKNMKGFVSEVAKKGLIIENARVGETLVGGFGGGSSGVANYFGPNSY